MNDDSHYFQIRAGLRLKSRILRIKEKYDYSGADIVRISIELGSQILEKLLEARDEMVTTYIKLLKKECRLRNSPKGRAGANK